MSDLNGNGNVAANPIATAGEDGASISTSSPAAATPLSAGATPFYSMRAPMAVACDLVKTNAAGGEDEDEETLTEVRAPRVALGKIMKRVKKGSGESPAAGADSSSPPSSPVERVASDTLGRDEAKDQVATNLQRPEGSSELPSPPSCSALSNGGGQDFHSQAQVVVVVGKEGPSPNVTSPSSNAEVDAYERARNKILNHNGNPNAEVEGNAGQKATPLGAAPNCELEHQNACGIHQHGTSSTTTTAAGDGTVLDDPSCPKRRKMKFRGIVANNEMGDYTRHQHQPHVATTGRSYAAPPHQHYVNPTPVNSSGWGAGGGATGPVNAPGPSPPTMSVHIGQQQQQQHSHAFVPQSGRGGLLPPQHAQGRGRGGQQGYLPTTHQPPLVHNNINNNGVVPPPGGAGPFGNIAGIPLSQPLPPPPPMVSPNLTQAGHNGGGGGAVVRGGGSSLMAPPAGIPRATPEQSLHNVTHNNSNNNSNFYHNNYNNYNNSNNYTNNNNGAGDYQQGTYRGGSYGRGGGGFNNNNNYEASCEESYNNNNNYYNNSSRGGRGGGFTRGRGGPYAGYSSGPENNNFDSYAFGFPQTTFHVPSHDHAPPYNNNNFVHPRPNHYQAQPMVYQRPPPQRMDRGGRRVQPSTSTAVAPPPPPESVGYGAAHQPQPAAAW